MTEKYKLILTYLHSVQEATLDQVMENVDYHNYLNTRKYMTETLSRMVNSGYITRIKRGLYRANEYKQFFKKTEYKNQLKLEL